jgi:hypothetical protein
MNGLQVFPNVVGLLGLSGLVATAAECRRSPAESRQPPAASR